MMSESTVRIRFTGSRVVRRIVGDYVWDASNDHVTDVDLDTAADLLTSPENDWQLAEKPKQTVHRDLAERMGLAPKELIIVPDDAPLRHALAQERERDLLLHELDRRRHADGPAPAAGAWRRALLGALVMPLPAHLQLLQALVDAPDPNPSPAAGRVFVAGARHGGIADDERLQAQALRVVGDDLRGLTDAAAPVPAGDPWSQLPMVMGPLQDLEPDPVARAEQTVRAACARRADRIIHFAAAGDEREPWFRRWLQQACKREGLDFTAVDLPAAPAASTAPASAPRAVNTAMGTIMVNRATGAL